MTGAMTGTMPETRTDTRTGTTTGTGKLDARIPAGPIEQAWDNARFEMKLVNPANKRRHTLLVVGSGLAGASAAATLGELGYNVKCFCFQDSPRRAHSIAAQGGINAAKNYQNDGDSIYRLFYDCLLYTSLHDQQTGHLQLPRLSFADPPAHLSAAQS